MSTNRVLFHRMNIKAVFSRMVFMSEIKIDLTMKKLNFLLFFMLYNCIKIVYSGASAILTKTHFSSSFASNLMLPAC